MEWQQSRYYKNISLFIKLAIVVLAFGFIYKQVFYRHDREMLEQSLRAALRTTSFTLISLTLLLMFLNWLIEAWKWKLLVDRSERVSLGIAVKAVLSGVTIGAFTPNRFGEFAGRIFYLERTSRVDAILVTFAGSAAQLLVTLIAGGAGLIVLNEKTDADVSFNIAGILVMLVSLLLLSLYLYIARFVSLIGGWKIFNRYRGHLKVLGSYSSRELFNVLLLSGFRYAVFSVQFYLLLKVFGVNAGFMISMVAISVTFLVITVVPSFALAELGIRGSAALACIGLISNNSIGIVAASFTLWIINIAIPAMAGAFFVFGLKFFKEER